MKKKFTPSAFACALIIGLVSSYSANAQNDTRDDSHTITIVVPPVALLDIENSATKNFSATFTQSSEAGDKLTAPGMNNSLWLNYSSIMTGSTPKHVDVRATGLVAGVDIHLQTLEAVGGAGTLGTATAATIVLTDANQTIITGIGSGYTTTGINNGHRLQYTFTTDDTKYASLRDSSTPVTVLYTLGDN